MGVGGSLHTPNALRPECSKYASNSKLDEPQSWSGYFREESLASAGIQTANCSAHCLTATTTVLSLLSNRML